MQYSFVSGSQGSSARLILIFAGWGMDSRPFSKLRRPGYDIAVVWDYRSHVFPEDIIKAYDEVCLIAWSMGVIAATTAMDAFKDRLTLTVAVNGTPRPVDDAFGIPEATFKGTLEGLSERTLEKFMMRMCGGAGAYSGFKVMAPLRPLDELKEELEALWRLTKSGSESMIYWDHAVISDGDAIFPPANQEAAWKILARSTSRLPGPHLPDFQDIIDHFVMNKEVVGRRFERSNASYSDHAVVQREIAGELMCLIQRHLPEGIHHILETGCGTGLLSRGLATLAYGNGGRLELWDLVNTNPIPGADFRNTDAEIAIRSVPDCTYSLIASASTIQWFNSPVKFLCEAMRTLRPGGLLAVSTFATGNLVEVAQATGIFLPLLSENDWRRAVTGLGEVLAIHAKRKILSFEDPVKVFRHLKATGVNALSPKEPLIRSLDRYPREADGSCRLTYFPVFIVLRKK